MENELEHNRKAFLGIRQPKGSGVACSQCGTELLFAGNTIKLSHPPQRKVYCPKCGRTTTLFG